MMGADSQTAPKIRVEYHILKNMEYQKRNIRILRVVLAAFSRATESIEAYEMPRKTQHYRMRLSF